MGKSYTGDQIVAKVRQASYLINQGKSLQDVWSRVQISRQTYNRWKGICDSIQSELESQTAEAARQQIDSFKEENRQLRIELAQFRDKVREYEIQLEAANQQLRTLSDLQDQLSAATKAGRVADKVVEDPKARLSKSEEHPQGQIATDEELKHRYERSEERSQKTTGRPEQQKVESAGTLSKENLVQDNDGSALAVSTSQDRDVSAEMPEEMLSELGPGTRRANRGTWIGKLYRDVRDMVHEQPYPIGLDIQDDCMTMAQVSTAKNGINLVQARNAVAPDGIAPDSDDWGRWAVGTIRDSIRSGGFRNRRACLSLPVRNTFIETVAIPDNTLDIETAILERMRRKLPYKATLENTIIKWIPTEGSHVIAIALERKQVERCLAICDKTRLKAERLSVWPLALINSYSLLPAQTDSSFVVLLDVAVSYTNVAVCRGRKLYYARTIHIGARDLESVSGIRFLVDGIDSCREDFAKIYGDRPIERSIFFAGDSVDRNTIAQVAKQVGISAQLGNPFGVIRVSNGSVGAVNAENAGSSWLVAIGLGLEKGMGRCPKARTAKEPAKPQIGRPAQMRRPINSDQWISKTEKRLLRYLILAKPALEMDADSEPDRRMLPRAISSFFRWSALERAYT